MSVQPGPGEAEILVDVVGRVATVTLNRPEKRNALTRELRAELWELLHTLDADPSVRAVVLTGAGAGFCAGSDTGRLQDYSADGVQQHLETQKHSSDTILRLDTPVIAAVNGSTAGLGFAIAAMADMRFTCPDAKWTTAFASLGLIAESGLSWLLPRLVGLGRATDLLLSARIFSGDEAHRMGLAQELHPRAELLSAAQDYAEDIARNSPYSVRTMRQQLRTDMNSPLELALQQANRLVVQSVGGPDFAEAKKALREHREPRFD